MHSHPIPSHQVCLLKPLHALTLNPGRSPVPQYDRPPDIPLPYGRLADHS